jgi:hypothetical protein
MRSIANIAPSNPPRQVSSASIAVSRALELVPVVAWLKLVRADRTGLNLLATIGRFERRFLGSAQMGRPAIACRPPARACRLRFRRARDRSKGEVRTKTIRLTMQKTTQRHRTVFRDGPLLAEGLSSRAQIQRGNRNEISARMINCGVQVGRLRAS